MAVEGETRGYICEVYDSHFRLPDLGPIGNVRKHRSAHKKRCFNFNQ